MRNMLLQELARRAARYLITATLSSALAVTSYGQASESEPDERPLQVPPITLDIEDVAEVRVQLELPPEAEIATPQLAVPLPVAGELQVVAPELPKVLSHSDGNGSGLLSPGLALQASIEVGNNGLLRSSVALQRAGTGPRFQLQVNHQLMDGFGPEQAPEQGYHRTDDLHGVYRTDLGSAELNVSGRYRRVEDGLQGKGGTEDGKYALRDQLVVGQAQLTVEPTDVLTVSGEIGGSSVSRSFRGSDAAAVTELEGWAVAGATAQIRDLEIGVLTDYSFRHVGDAKEDSAHQLLGQLELGYDLSIPLRLSARGGLQYASNDANTNVRFPFELSVTGTPHYLFSLRVAAGREVVDRDLAGLYKTLEFVEKPEQVFDTRQWFGDASVRAAVSDDLQVIASLRGETGINRINIKDVEDINSMQGMHILAQGDTGTLRTGLGLRWAINPTAALRLDWSGAFFDVPLYLAPHVVSVGMRATWGNGSYGIENNVDWVFPSELEVSYGSGVPIMALPIVSASGFYNISDSIAVIFSIADMLQLLSDRPRYGLAPYVEPGFQASVGVEVNL